MTPAAALSSERAVELADTVLSSVVGVSCLARFFLAGGAFKTLLHGRRPRDLDLWATTPGDRDRLLDTLARRGATRLGARPFADAVGLAGHVVEVPHRAEFATLEELLERFDIAISAVGVEHAPGAPRRAVVHPLALRSVEELASLEAELRESLQREKPDTPGNIVDLLLQARLREIKCGRMNTLSESEFRSHRSLRALREALIERHAVDLLEPLSGGTEAQDAPPAA